MRKINTDRVAHRVSRRGKRNTTARGRGRRGIRTAFPEDRRVQVDSITPNTALRQEEFHCSNVNSLSKGDLSASAPSTKLTEDLPLT